MDCANPVFNDLFDGKGEKPELKIDSLLEIAADYAHKLATPIYVGIRTGYLQNEEEVKALANDRFVIDTPIGIVQKFIETYLKA
jgi:CRISPR-associated protein Cst2